ncbi:MAG: hypothetical protein Kow00105_07730 [Phycisphaeraceae bacterium]
MNLSRREMLVAGLGLLVASCSETTTSLITRPGTPWPTNTSRPVPRNTRQVAVPTPTPTPRYSPSGLPGLLPRSWWTKYGPNRSNINPMAGVNRITVHHEGYTPVWFTDVASTRARMEQIRRVHTRDRRWADIGYHFVIDRAGRVIEGRSVAYQGAHVSHQNEHNIGVMLLGNFEQQSPTPQQLASLQTTLRYLMARYKVPVSRVYTHRELGKTACPGRHLQPRVARLRDSGALA